MSTRNRKEAKRYSAYLKSSKPNAKCIFCEISTGNSELLKEFKSFKIITNIFPYSYWDREGVSDHIMIVPKKHTDTLSDFTSHEAIEFVELLASYESMRYNVYTRAPSSGLKSIHHQHTHLIKPDRKKRKLVVFLEKPYIRLAR